MAYKDNQYIFQDSIEHEVNFIGRYGAKGEKRHAKEKKTPEAVRKNNKKEKEKNIRRLIKNNFQPLCDLWVTLTYLPGERLSFEEAEHKMGNYIRRIQRQFKNAGETMKYIWKTEIGGKGAVHHHLIINRLENGKLSLEQLLTKQWKDGRVHMQLLYAEGGFQKLAEYIAKPNKATEDLFETGSYHPSTKLKQPIKIVKEYKRRTLQKELEYGIEPKPGYYIDKNSVVMGVNPFTGRSYLHYTEYRCR